MRFFSNVAVLGGALLLLMSVYPGVLDDAIFLAIIFLPIWLPALVIVSLLVGLGRDNGDARPAVPRLGDPATGPRADAGPAPRRRRPGLALAIAVSLLALAATGVPRRAAFALSRAAFHRLVAGAPVSAYQGESLDRFLGVYHVDRFAADPRGGVYFRTHSGPDGLGPDRTSYGFAFRPNDRGTPFGNARYALSHVVGEWHCFSASNDY